MDDVPFLDTNPILRHALKDHVDHSRRATALIVEIERGERRVATTHTVIFEAIYTMEKTYRVARTDVRDLILPVIELPGLVLPGKRRYRKVFALWVLRRALSFADCYHAVLAQERHGATIISFDRGFDRVPGLMRREP